MTDGKVSYGSLVNEKGGIIDDLTVFRFSGEHFWVCPTPSRVDIVTDWLIQQRHELHAYVTNIVSGTAYLSIQGPHSRETIAKITDAEVSNDALPYFRFTEAVVAEVPAVLSRTGYSGELGYELFYPRDYSEHMWSVLLDAGIEFGIAPCGTEPRTTFEGEHWQLRDALCQPKPLQERLPLWIGGKGERRTLRIVAELADGWNTFLTSEQEYRHLLDVLAEHCADVGRDPAEIRKQLNLAAILAADEAELKDRERQRRAVEASDILSRRVATTPERLVERLRPYRDLGVGDFLLLARPSADDRTIELFATQVAPALRR